MMDFVQLLAGNPQLLAAILAIIYNIAGYVMSMLKVAAVEKYKITELVKTLVLFETLFTLLSTFGGVAVEYTTIATVILAIIVSLKDKLSELAKAMASA